MKIRAAQRIGLGVEEMRDYFMKRQRLKQHSGNNGPQLSEGDAQT